MNDIEINNLKNILDDGYHIFINMYDYSQYLSQINFFYDSYKNHKITISYGLNINEGYISIGQSHSSYINWSPLMKFNEIDKYLKLKAFW